MRLDLAKIRTPHEHFERVFQPEAFAGGSASDADFTIVSPVKLKFEVFKDKDTFRLVGRTETTHGVPCSRCLEPFELPVDASFDLRYLPATEASNEADSEVAEDDLETSYYRDDQIDLNELMREQFYLVLPMKPLCQDDCRGLCTQCGTNLNTGSCDCAPAWEDPRLAPLKGLGRSRDSKTT